MTRKLRKAYPVGRSSQSRETFSKPFWLSSVNYYILTTGITIACFFITWGILHAAEEEMPWILAGIVAGLILISAVIIREFVFKKNYRKTILAQKRLDYNIKSVYQQTNRSPQTNRLTIERNNAIIQEIEKRSRTAKSMAKMPELHFEVFEMCNEYFRKSERELEGIFKGSPRYDVMMRGRKKLESLRHYHLISWASSQSQLFVQSAKMQVGMSEKIENAQRALAVLETAIEFYPDDENLIQSVNAVKEFIVSIKVSHWIEQGERSAFKNHFQRAINHYRDALFFLARENERTPERELMAEKINLRIEELRKKQSK